MPAIPSEIDVGERRVLYRGRVPAGHVLRLDDRGDWQLEPEPREGVEVTPVSRPRPPPPPALLASPPPPVAPVALPSGGLPAGRFLRRLAGATPPRRWGAVAAAWLAGVASGSILAGPIVTAWRASPVPPAPNSRALAPVASPGVATNALAVAANGMIGFPPSGHRTEAGGAAMSVPAIVPASVLARARPSPGPAPSPVVAARRARPRQRAPGHPPAPSDEAPVVNEGAPALAALAASGVAPDLVGPPRPDRLVAVQDDRTVLVTDPSRRTPRAVRVGQLLPSGARLLSVDPAQGRAATDRGPLELR